MKRENIQMKNGSRVWSPTAKKFANVKPVGGSGGNVKLGNVMPNVTDLSQLPKEMADKLKGMVNLPYTPKQPMGKKEIDALVGGVTGSPNFPAGTRPAAVPMAKPTAQAGKTVGTAVGGFLSKPPVRSGMDAAPSVSRDAWRKDQFSKISQSGNADPRQLARQKFLARKYGFKAPSVDVSKDMVKIPSGEK
jgi:hypothetical protein